MGFYLLSVSSFRIWNENVQNRRPNVITIDSIYIWFSWMKENKSRSNQLDITCSTYSVTITNIPLFLQIILLLPPECHGCIRPRQITNSWRQYTSAIILTTCIKIIIYNLFLTIYNKLALCDTLIWGRLKGFFRHSR